MVNHDRRALLTSIVGIAGLGALFPTRGLSKVCSATSSDILGPFYIPDRPNRARIAGPKEPGDPLVVRGRVLGPDCATPLLEAWVDVWHADASGQYHDKNDDFRLRGYLLTDDEGSFAFTTIVPGRYKVGHGYRPAHVHFMVGHSHHQPLTTQLYFKGDPYLGAKDGCGHDCDSSDAGRIVDLKKSDAGAGFSADFQIVLRTRRT